MAFFLLLALLLPAQKTFRSIAHLGLTSHEKPQGFHVCLHHLQRRLESWVALTTQFQLWLAEQSFIAIEQSKLLVNRV
jgi:hypothetical protein